MNPPNNIVQELEALNASFAREQKGTVYAVPLGYFGGLAEEILKKVKALEETHLGALGGYGEEPVTHLTNFIDNGLLSEEFLRDLAVHQDGAAGTEIAFLSPLINRISRVTPFTVPEGYFQELSEMIPFFAQSEVEEDERSVVLDSISRELPYTVPQGYFEDVKIPGESNVIKMKQAPAKVVSMKNTSWIKYAAAAAVVAFVTISSFFYFNRQQSGESIANSFAWVEKNLKKVSTDDINRFVETTGVDNTIAQTAKPDEIKNLLRDVSDKEIQDFLNDTPSDESDTDDLLLN